MPVSRLVSIQRRAGTAAAEGGADESQVRYLSPIRDDAWLRIGDYRRAGLIPEGERIGKTAIAAGAPLLAGIGDHEIAHAVGGVVRETEAVGDVAKAVR